METVSRRKVLVTVPSWWPPKVGDKLRKFDHVERGAIARLCHVVSVLEHAGSVKAVVAYYGIHRKWWHYEIVTSLNATWEFWPDGAKCPSKELRAQLKSKENR